MAGLNSWLSPGVLHALGWALIHSVWQCLSVAALVASLMAFSRRPSVRYLMAVGALALMLASPAATFLYLLKPAAPVHVFLPASSGTSAPDQPKAVKEAPAAAIVAAPSRAANKGARDEFAVSVGAVLENSSDRVLSPSELPWLVAAWLCGVVVFSLRFVGGFLLLERRRRNLSVAPNVRILALCREVQQQVGLDRAIRYLECGWLRAPAVFGWLQPIVLLPISALSGLSEAQLRAVIAHELAHIRRYDAFVNLFQIMVETLLFYHPAMWWLNRRIRAERELCCDQIAVSLTGNRLEYAKAVALMAEWERVPALAMAANRGPLSERILYILGRKPSGAERMLGLTGGVLFLTAALAAANTLFGIAAAPIAQAKENLRAATSPTLAVAGYPARQVTNEPATKEKAGDTVVPNDSTALNAATPDPIDPDHHVEKLAPPEPDLSGLRLTEALTTPTLIASSAPAGAPLSERSTIYRCDNKTVFGRVVSPEAIQMQGFVCSLDGNLGESPEYGSCPKRDADPLRYGRSCKFDVTMQVQFADPADANGMRPGKIVGLSGVFRVAMENGNASLNVAGAKLIWTNPLDRPNPMTCRPWQLVELSKQLGKNLCVQSDILTNLDEAGPALRVAATSPIVRPTLHEISDPAAITCRQPGSDPASRGASPITCAYNSYWMASTVWRPTGIPPDSVAPIAPAAPDSGAAFIGGVIWNGP